MYIDACFNPSLLGLLLLNSFKDSVLEKEGTNKPQTEEIFNYTSATSYNLNIVYFIQKGLLNGIDLKKRNKQNINSYDFGYKAYNLLIDNSKKLRQENFLDVFKESYPNEVDNLVFTWSSNVLETKSMSSTPLAYKIDGIDYIFYKENGVKIKDVSIVGPKESFVYNKPNTSKENLLLTIGHGKLTIKSCIQSSQCIKKTATYININDH